MRRTKREKALYHQIHPLNLVVDVTTGIWALKWPWGYRLAPALAVGVLPSMAVSAVLVTRADLDRLRRSRLGRYMRRSTTPAAHAARLGGYTLAAFAACGTWAGSSVQACWWSWADGSTGWCSRPPGGCGGDRQTEAAQHRSTARGGARRRGCLARRWQGVNGRPATGRGTGDGPGCGPGQPRASTRAHSGTSSSTSGGSALPAARQASAA